MDGKEDVKIQMTGHPNFYSDQIMEHIRSPQNMGEMQDADGVGTAGNPVCGDVMRLFIKVATRKVRKDTEDTEEYIEDVKFQTLGCGAAIATSSMATTMIKGKRLSEVEEISNKAVADALGGLPPQKLHCSVLAADALKKAIEGYRKKKI